MGLQGKGNWGWRRREFTHRGLLTTCESREALARETAHMTGSDPLLPLAEHKLHKEVLVGLTAMPRPHGQDDQGAQKKSRQMAQGADCSKNAVKSSKKKEK